MMKRRSFLKALCAFIPSLPVVSFASTGSFVTTFEFSRDKRTHIITVEASKRFDGRATKPRFTILKQNDMFPFLSNDQLFDKCKNYLADYGVEGINKNPNKLINHIYEDNEVFDLHILGKARELLYKMPPPKSLKLHVTSVRSG